MYATWVPCNCHSGLGWLETLGKGEVETGFSLVMGGGSTLSNSSTFPQPFASACLAQTPCVHCLLSTSASVVVLSRGLVPPQGSSLDVDISGDSRLAIELRVEASAFPQAT